MTTGFGTFKDALGFGVLNDFLASLSDQNAYGRPNLFEVQIHPPTKPSSPAMGGHDIRSISLRAESFQLPGRSVQTQISSAGAILGPQREYVTEVTFAEEISMTFIATAGLDERKFFEQWQQLSFNKDTHAVGYYRDYVGTLDMYLLDRNNRKTFGIRLEECFPKSIAPLELSLGPSTEVTKTLVSWSFRKTEPLDAESQQSLGGTIVDTFTNTVERNLTRNLPAVVRKLL